MAEKSKKPFIRVDNIRKVYRMGEEKIIALNDVSLDIPDFRTFTIETN